MSLEEAYRNHDDVCITEQSANEYGYDLFFELYGADIPASIHCYCDTDSFTHDMELNGELISFSFAGNDYVVTNGQDF